MAHKYLLDGDGTDTGDPAIPLTLPLNGTGTGLWTTGVQPPTCTAPQGQSLRTGGQNVRLLDSTGSGLISTDPFTVTAWIKPETADLEPGEHFAIWYTKPGGRAFMISILDGHWAASVGTTNAPNIIGPEAEPDRWQYVGISYDGQGRANLYVDTDADQYQATGITQVQGATLGIGWGGKTWTGAIDLVSISTTYQEFKTFLAQRSACS